MAGCQSQSINRGCGVNSTRRDREWALRNWQNQGRYTLPADGGKASALAQAARNSQRVFILYDGGSTPGATRWIYPRELFGITGYGGYLRAYCEKRQEERTFSIDKITILSVAGETVSSGTTPTPPSVAAPSPRAGVPVWVWIVGTIVVLWILSKQ